MQNRDELLISNQETHFYMKYGKRFMDIIGSLTFLIILLPVFMLLILVTYLFSGRPIFFSQQRSGLNNKPFTIWKFRTMASSDEGSSGHSYHWKGEVPKNFLFEKPKDIPITRLGRIYRKYSIDELPQLWHVLKGEMSFVGPRPEILEITANYSPVQRQRLLVKQGITGYAQINGRSTITHGEKIAYDLFYVRHCSFLLDFKIILKTILIVFSGKDAS